jgi:hypothetical protein
VGLVELGGAYDQLAWMRNGRDCDLGQRVADWMEIDGTEEFASDRN